ncbi:MAG: hypothetical protein Q8M16_01690 [Pirellulaceae bacterium]|nr:hypothetical protein [Pirellulaceae bacterium]
MITVTRKIQLSRTTNSRRRIAPAQDPETLKPKGRIPRIARLMALAIRLERMLRAGDIPDLTELARIANVTQPRMSQILNLNMLAPEIQEELLFLPPVENGKPALHEKMLRPISSQVDWSIQRQLWREITRS